MERGAHRVLVLIKEKANLFNIKCIRNKSIQCPDLWNIVKSKKTKQNRGEKTANILSGKTKLQCWSIKEAVKERITKTPASLKMSGCRCGVTHRYICICCQYNYVRPRKDKRANMANPLCSKHIQLQRRRGAAASRRQPFLSSRRVSTLMPSELRNCINSSASKWKQINVLFLGNWWTVCVRIIMFSLCGHQKNEIKRYMLIHKNVYFLSWIFWTCVCSVARFSTTAHRRLWLPLCNNCFETQIFLSGPCSSSLSLNSSRVPSLFLLLWESVCCPQTPAQCIPATNFHCTHLHHALFPCSLTAAVHSKHRDVSSPLVFLHSNYMYRFLGREITTLRKLWKCSLFPGVESLLSLWKLIESIPVI